MSASKSKTTQAIERRGKSNLNGALNWLFKNKINGVELRTLQQGKLKSAIDILEWSRKPKAENLKIKKIGFSTGALERGDFKKALQWMIQNKLESVELSALRYEELKPLVKVLGSIPVNKFQYVSFHAPSAFPATAERNVVKLLRNVVSHHNWNVIVHPDVIRNRPLWRQLGSNLLIENMDRRKPIGRSVKELQGLFDSLPNARLCLDLAHARQLDTTLILLSDLINKYSRRIAQIHISELDSWCQHQPMSNGAVSDYQSLADRFASSVPVIIESMLDGDRTGLRMKEFYLAYEAMHFHKADQGAENPSSKKNKNLWKHLVSTVKKRKYFTQKEHVGFLHHLSEFKTLNRQGKRSEIGNRVLLAANRRRLR